MKLGREWTLVIVLCPFVFQTTSKFGIQCSLFIISLKVEYPHLPRCYVGQGMLNLPAASRYRM